jgi:hypothetical protein
MLEAAKVKGDMDLAMARADLCASVNKAREHAQAVTVDLNDRCMVLQEHAIWGQLRDHRSVDRRWENTAG